MPIVEPERSVADIEQFVVLINPTSSSYATVQHRLHQLRDTPYGTKLTYLTTSKDPAHTRDQLHKTLEEGFGLIIAGGDGSINYAVNDLLADDEIARWGVPILPAGGGNADDSAHSLNGPPAKQSLFQILQQGRILPIMPIRTELIDVSGEASLRYGLSYVGLGGTALAAKLIDDDGHRHHRLYKYTSARTALEARLVIKTILEAQDFIIESAGHERTLSELTVANGRYEAKHGRWPLEIDEPQLYISEVGQKGLLRSALWLGRLASQSKPSLAGHIKPPAGYYVYDRPSNEPNDGLEFTLQHSPTYMHWDAEATLLSTGTHVDIRRSKQPIYAITTRLAEAT